MYKSYKNWQPYWVIKIPSSGWKQSSHMTSGNDETVRNAVVKNSVLYHKSPDIYLEMKDQLTSRHAASWILIFHRFTLDTVHYECSAWSIKFCVGGKPRQKHVSLESTIGIGLINGDYIAGRVTNERKENNAVRIRQYVDASTFGCIHIFWHKLPDNGRFHCLKI
mmetsp:Transcript_61662/g.84797  ORF Transcript_61662/g.84797 Transcript_61662/m.84797 type:complete len:165 (+) Transcript_61662:227-721(+)